MIQGKTLGHAGLQDSNLDAAKMRNITFCSETQLMNRIVRDMMETRIMVWVYRIIRKRTDGKSGHAVFSFYHP